MNWTFTSNKHFSSEHLQKVNKRELPEDFTCLTNCTRKGARGKRRTRSII
ncbi:MAG: hypothetical protein KC496_08870 [Anaerolineae bacterium]|nr:hypothetical protein [Anaerolineae bacterium]